MKKIVLLMIALIFTASSAGAAVLQVPAQYPSIQAAINQAQPGDTVLVAPGIYYENIDFKGKGIVVASHFIINNDTTFISATVINGSQPAIADTASCVLMRGTDITTSQDSSAALTGFTITGGTGTRWEDEHNQGSWYREGGGILIQYLSPRISFNHITGNSASDKTNCVSAGGGAIRCGDGNPSIFNNIIDHNTGRYGGGIVLNFSGAVIKNNIITLNSGGEDYGGGGIWMYGQDQLSRPRIIENNTIVFNSSALGGGGIRVWSTSLELRNTILWGNNALNNDQIQVNGTLDVSYCDIQGGHTGTGILDADPLFDIQSYFLKTNSACIDKGNPAASYYDPENPLSPGQAMFPAMDSVRGDMGAYGGQGSALLGNIPSVMTAVKQRDKLKDFNWNCYPDPFENIMNIDFEAVHDTRINLSVLDVSGNKILSVPDTVVGLGKRTLSFDMKNFPSGIYFVTVHSEKSDFSRKVIKR